jgi:hypothetical protein
MTMSAFVKRCALLGLLLVMMACGSDEGGGTGGTGIVASGTVTGFGSIFVDGREFDTSEATITLNGKPGSEADLRLGHVVTVRGTLDPVSTVGRAETIVFESNARGPIESLDPATNSLVVLGKSVLVDNRTRFGVAQLNALVVGNVVEVSGFEDADGALRATRVDKLQDAFTPGTEIEVEGTVTNLDAAHQTFTLSMLQVDFSAAQLISLPAGQLRNGQVVSVKSSRDIADGVLVADSVEVEEADFNGDEGDEFELQGIITRLTSADTFEISGQPVRLTPATVFEGGTAADLALNLRVEAEGFFDRNGALVAEDVEFGDDDDAFELQGIITRLTSADTFEISGQPVRLTSATVFEGGTAADLAVDVRVEVEGLFDTDGVLVATEIAFLQ